MIKKLENIIGIENISFIECTIDFINLGVKYKATNLIGYGFDSCCYTCDNHYSIKFTKGNAGESELVRDGHDYTLSIPIDNSITNGNEFCYYLYHEIYKHKEFVNHFQQYEINGSVLKVYDNRGMTLGKFYTSYINLKHASLFAWYEGPPIELGNVFDKENVVIYLCIEGEDRIRMDYTEPGILMNTPAVTQVGDNWYTVSFTLNDETIKCAYAVPGILPEDDTDPEFKVWYILKESLPGHPETIDLTKEFKPYFTYGRELIITWNEFINCIYDLANKKGKPYFGMFGLTAPKRTGLYGKYASTWHVYCPNDHTLKAEIYKLYTSKEEEENGT